MLIQDLHHDANSGHHSFDDLDKDLHTDPSHSCSTVVLTKIHMLIQVTAVLSVFLKICLLPVSDLSYSKFCLLIPKKELHSGCQ